MTREEVKLLNVGDIVWIMCRDEEPGTAAKCRVTKEDDGYGVVEVKCVGRADCEGHRVWYGDIRKSEVEVYEKEISRFEYVISSNDETIRNSRAENRRKKSDLGVLKARLQKAREEAEKVAWVILGDTVVEIFAHDSTYSKLIKYETKQEAYDAIADYYKNKFIEASLKGTGGFFPVLKEKIIFLPKTWAPASPDACFDRMGEDMNGTIWRFNKTHLYKSRQEVEAEFKK